MVTLNTFALLAAICRSTKIYKGDVLVRFVAENVMQRTKILCDTYIAFFVMIVHYLWFSIELKFLQKKC